MEVLIVALGILLAVSDISLADTSRCPSGLSRSATTRLATYGDDCFQFVRNEKYWDDARDYCWRYGGKLVTVNDAKTNTFLVRTLNSLSWTNNGVWIGLHDRSNEMTWHWVTDTRGGKQSLSWSNWGKGHPKGFLHHHRDCVRIVRGNGSWKWHETPCHLMRWHYRFVCQYKMSPLTTQHPSPYIVEGHDFNLGGAPTPEGDEHVKVKTTTTTTIKTTSTTVKIPPTPPKTTEDLMAKYEDYDDDLSGVLAPLHLRQEEENMKPKNIAGGVVACVVGLILAVVILIIVLIRRRRRQKFLEEMEDPTFCASNPTYSSANNNVYTGCGQYGADGQLLLDHCGAQANIAKAQNDYGVNLAGAKPNNPALATTVLAISGNHYEQADSSSLKAAKGDLTASPVQDNDANLKVEETKNSRAARLAPKPRAKQTLPRTPDDGYEVPTQTTNLYLPMNGSKKNLQAAGSEPYMNPQMKAGCASGTRTPQPYDYQKREHLYAEIPEEAGNIYQDLDDVQQELELLKESEA